MSVGIEPPKLGRFSVAVLTLSAVAAIFAGVYFATQAAVVRHGFTEFSEQTRLLRIALAKDHEWQVEHHQMLINMDKSIRAAVLRKEALIRAVIKKQYGWTEEDIDAAIRSEGKSIQNVDDLPIDDWIAPDLIPLQYANRSEEE